MLGYGTNDAAGGQIPPGTFKTNHADDDRHGEGGRPRAGASRTSRSRATARTTTLPAYNAVIDELTRTNQLQVGPDLYAHFMAHAQDQFTSDKLHPNDAGLAAMNQLWADAMRVVYP